MLRINSYNCYLNVNKVGVSNNTLFLNADKKSKCSFKAVSYAPRPLIRTQLATKEEQEKYNELNTMLDSEYKKKLNFALKHQGQRGWIIK